MRALFNRVLLYYDKVMFDLSGYLIDLKNLTFSCWVLKVIKRSLYKIREKSSKIREHLLTTPKGLSLQVLIKKLR